MSTFADMEDLFSWFSQNLTLISTMANLLMVLVWVFYARLFYRDFRSRHHPRIMIHQDPDKNPDSSCLIVNLGERMVNVAAVFVTEPDSDRVTEITDYRAGSEEEHTRQKIQSMSKQGPLGSGQIINLGSFSKLISRLENFESASGDDLNQDRKIEVRVAFFHDSTSRPVGAYRSFTVKSLDDHREIHPDSFHTVQLLKSSERKKVLDWLKSSIDQAG